VNIIKEDIRNNKKMMGTVLNKDTLKIDCEKESKIIEDFISKKVSESNKDGVVIGLSGGIDSSVNAALLSRSIDREKILGVLMFENGLNSDDFKDASQLAKSLKIKTYTFPINSMVKEFSNKSPFDNVNKLTEGNLKSRLRMNILYYFSNHFNYLVAGTSNKSESSIGYFTKYGDGGADFFPTAHLYKTQVKEMGKYLGISKKIINKEPSPNLWKNHKATDEIPVDFDKLDLVLYGLFEAKMNYRDIMQQLDIPLSTLEKIENMYHNSEHKRKYPDMIKKDTLYHV
jgi:NAD+ synthase